LIPQRVGSYDPRWLDSLCMMGVVGWGRISPHPAFDSAETGGSKSAARRIVPTSMAPVTFFVREDALWMDLCLRQRQIPEATLRECLSELAGKVRTCLEERGAMFSGDLARCLDAPAADLQRALWELVAAGIVTADGFDCLRMLIDPRRKGAFSGHPLVKSAKQRHGAGRWSLLSGDAAMDNAAQHEAQIESACAVLLRRYGVVFRDVVAREATMPRWRDLLGIFRRLEARGEVRGGRFLSGFGGEQFALPEAVESLREMRRKPCQGIEITVTAADPLNLVGIVVPGERVAAVPGKTVSFLDGAASANGIAMLDARPVETSLAHSARLAPDEIAVAGLFPTALSSLRESHKESAGV
jgi:ATP-dependent Lhr-like helicase